MSKVILVGGFHETVELCELANVEIVGIIDSMAAEQFMGYRLIGADADIERLAVSYRQYPLVITPDKPALRKKLVQLYKAHGFEFFSLISPKATVSRSAQLGEGVIVQSGVNISAAVSLGAFVKVNSCANLMHDCTVARYTTVAPNAVLLGRVTVGAESYVGANATILPNMAIGDQVMVGAGAVVTKSFSNGTVLAGNPARILANEARQA